MAQVPYTGVPTVSPSERGLEVSATPAAFGVETSGALERIGKAFGEVGGELWQRAEALQQLKNETQAKDESLKFMIELGERHAKFNALEGEARVADFGNYTRDMQEIYGRHRNNLGNDQAKNYFDNTATPAVRQSIFNAAGASATAQKEWSFQSDKATLKNLQNQSFDNPASDAEHEAREAQVRPLARNLAVNSPGGWSQSKEDMLTAEATSELWVHRVKGLERANPFAALEMMDANRKKITAPDFESLEKEVQSSVLSTGADDLALKKLTQYRKKDGTYSKDSVEMQDELRDEVTAQYGARFPLLAKAAVAQLENHWYRDNQAKKLDADTFRKTTQDWIAEHNPTTISQLPPDIVKKIGGPTGAAQPLLVQGWINTWQRDKSVIQKRQIYDDFIKMYNNENQKFMEQDLLSVPNMDKDNYKFFRGLQRAAQGGDIRVTNVMNQLRGAVPTEMRALNVFDRADSVKQTGTPDDYDNLTLAVHGAIQAYLETNHKMPDERAVREEIWPLVKQSVHGPGFFGNVFGGKETPFFKAPVPEEARKLIDKDYEAAGRKPPNEFDYAKEYPLMQFLQYFQDKKKATK